jgi:hypothetical protein
MTDRILMPRGLAGLALTALVAAVAACSATPAGSPLSSSAAGSSGPDGSSGPGESPVTSPAPSPTGVAALILRVTSEGGFIGPAAGLTAVPEVSVYADGRILSPGATDAIYPPPLLPAVAVRTVGSAGASAIIAAIRAAGLDHPSSAGPGIPGDFGTTIFAVNLGGAVVTTRIALGGGGPGRPGGGASQNPDAAAASDLLARLDDPNESWGTAGTPAMTLYSPTAYRVFVAPGAPASDGTMSPQPALDWPLVGPLATFGVPAVPDRDIAGLRQGAVLGADAAILGPVLAGASSQTPFISAGMLYTLYVRPLLPDEVPAPG